MVFNITYTPEQEEAMKELRKRLENELPPSLSQPFHTFYRFLKARNFNIDQAESMLRKHAIWRKSVNFDAVLEDFQLPEVLDKYAPTSFIGFDKEGSIVRLMAMGNGDGRGLLKSVNKYHALRGTMLIIAQDYKIIEQQSKKYGKVWLPTMLIIDCDNLTLAKITDRPSMEMFMKEIGMFQDNFPESIKSIYVINASVFFTMVWPVIKAVLVGPILEKIKVFGRDGWKEEFLKLVDADVLPASLGGKRTDPDGNPRCLQTVKWGGTVPSTYYLKKNIEKFAGKPGVKHAVIPRSSSVEVKVEVTISDTLLQWEFELKKYDIGVKVLVEESFSNEKSTTEIMPINLYETEYYPLQGKLKCEKPGTYIVVFSNMHSWVHGKELYYRTWITCPEQTSQNHQDGCIIINNAH